jgi:ribosomal protein L29
MAELKELRKMGLKELLKELGEKRAELFKVQFEVRTGQEKATHKIKNLKSYIAQIMTVINEIKEEPVKKEEEEKK